MTEERLSGLSIDAFLDRLSTPDPVPGGGSAAALAGAMGASLLHMVVALTAARADDAAQARLTEIRIEAASWQSELLRLAEIDAKAYAAVVAARRLPRGTEREADARAVQIVTATQEATRAPLDVARCADAVLSLSERLAPLASPQAISDVGVAGLLAVAALRGAALNVRINLPFLPVDDPLRDSASEEIERLIAGIEQRDGSLQATVSERMG